MPRASAAPGSQLDRLFDWLYAVDPVARLDVDLKLRLLLLDTVGCMLAGRRAAEVGALEARLGALEPGPVRFPNGRGLASSAAAMLGAVAACWDEACEGLASAHGRPGVAAIPAALALSLARAAPPTLGDLLRAIATGYEIGGRMGAALRIRPGMHVDANWPSLGAAAAAARALGLGAGLCATAVNIAACQLPYSLYLPIRAGATARNTYLGHAASLGVQSAIAAAAGITAPGDAHVDYARHALGREDAVLADPGEYLVLDAYFKPYAAVRHVHYGAAAAAMVREQIAGAALSSARPARSPVTTEAIRRIVLSIYEEATIYCGNRAPATAIQAQFSLSFGIAAMLRFGTLGPEVYRPAQFDDPELRRLEALVEIEVDAARTAAGRRGARLEVESDTGRWPAEVAGVKGDPDDPFTADDCCEKFARYAGAALGAGRAAAIARRLLEAGSDEPLAQAFPVFA